MKFDKILLIIIILCTLICFGSVNAQTTTINIAPSCEQINGVRFTAPSEGIYHFTVSGSYNPWPYGHAESWMSGVYIYKNRPVQWAPQGWGGEGIPNIYMDYTVSAELPIDIPMNAGDYITLIAFDGYSGYCGNSYQGGVIVSTIHSPGPGSGDSKGSSFASPVPSFTATPVNLSVQKDQGSADSPLPDSNATQKNGDSWLFIGIVIVGCATTVVSFLFFVVKRPSSSQTPTDSDKREISNSGALTKMYQNNSTGYSLPKTVGSTTTSPPSETPSSPVSQFTPRPLTPKQLPPDLSDRYSESEFIGKGGFARVFKAKRKDGKFVAVKIPIAMDAVTGKSFIAEMQNWTKLSHPNIVRLYDFNIMPLPYFEEELCDSALADQNKPLESEEAAWILFNICEGLKFAHTQKIIHRDLKPQNILLKNGVPKISDWGLSRILSDSTTTTTTSFTPHYAAPEQINGRVKDERTDIWQLGVILYELGTGILPFQGDSMVEIGMNIATKDPKRPGEIQPDAQGMDIVVMKCLQKDPAKRYQSVLELQKDLALYLRENYTELLKTSVTAKDYNRSAYYCGDLVMINMLTGDIPTSYKYLLDLVHYSKGDVKAEAQELSEQIKMRMEMGVTEIPDELIQKAEMIVHRVSVGFRNRG